MNASLNFYNNIFITELTLLVIITAVVFAFIQIAYTQFSYREVKPLFKNCYLRTFFISSVLVLLFAESSCLILSFPQYNYFPPIGRYLNMFLQYKYYPIILLFGVFISLALFIFFARSNIIYFTPSNIALVIADNIKPESIAHFLFKKYGIPHHSRKQSGQECCSDEELDFLIKHEVMTAMSDKEKIDDNLKLKQIQDKQRIFQKQNERELRKYNKLTKKAKNAYDPFEPLNAAVIRAINANDIAVLNNVEHILADVTVNFLVYYRKHQDFKCLDPNGSLTMNFIIHVVETLQFYFNIRQLEYTQFKILDISQSVIISAWSCNYDKNEAQLFLHFWKINAQKSLGKNPNIFHKVMTLYNEFADEIAKKRVEASYQVINEIFLHHGCLGESLLSKGGRDQRPLMYNKNYEDEYKHLLTRLYNLGSEIYLKHAGTADSSMYIDTVKKLFDKVISMQASKEFQFSNDQLNGYTDAIALYVKATIKSKNCREAAFATLKLTECYRELINNKLDDNAKDTLQSLIKICGIAYANKETLGQIDPLNCKIDEYIMRILEACPYSDTISHVMNDLVVPREDGLGESRWDFIKTLGKRLHTNFGLMFDWETSELYDVDDPRRK